MKQLIEFGAVLIGAAIQNVCANVDFDVLSLPGGSLIAVVLWLYAGAAGSVRRVGKVRTSITIVCGAGTGGIGCRDPRDRARVAEHCSRRVERHRPRRIRSGIFGAISKSRFGPLSCT